MFYKRKNKAQRQGLGHVIEVDNQQIFVKYGGEYYRVTPIDIQPGKKKVLDKRRGSAVDKEKEVKEIQKHKESREKILIQMKIMTFITVIMQTPLEKTSVRDADSTETQ